MEASDMPSHLVVILLLAMILLKDLGGVAVD